MEKIIITVISILSVLIALYKVIMEIKKILTERKEYQQVSEEYIQRFGSKNESKYGQQNLFDFNTIQDRRALLKKNTGKDLCNEDIEIEYVEYCPTIQYK